MDVYDEVDRRETDAGRVTRFRLPVCSLQHAAGLTFAVICSVVGNTEPQHPSDRDDRGTFPSCEPDVFLHTQPGTSPFHTALNVSPHSAVRPQLTPSRVFSFRDGKNWRDLTHTNLRLW